VSIHDEIAPEEMRKAAELYSKSWHWNPLAIGAAVDAGNSHYHLKEYEKALSYYDSALRIWPRSFYANYRKAKCFRDLGRYDEMVASLRRARLLGSPMRNKVRFSEDFSQFKHDPAFEAFESEFR
jgi:tetratricopeptide (TPR) repeat protein